MTNELAGNRTAESASTAFACWLGSSGRDDRFPSFAGAGRGLETAKRYLEDARRPVRRDLNDTSAKVSQAIALSPVSFSQSEFHAKAARGDGAGSSSQFQWAGRRVRTSSVVILVNRVVTMQRLAAADLKVGYIFEARRVAEPALATEHW